MRLGYSRRLARRLRTVRPAIRKMGVTWAPWMQQVMLYYYYPEKLASAKSWVKQLAEILVACEQFEAYSNQRVDGTTMCGKRNVGRCLCLFGELHRRVFSVAR